jgi:hypothetical protein
MNTELLIQSITKEINQLQEIINKRKKILHEIKNNNTDFNNFNDIVQNETNEICQ